MLCYNHKQKFRRRKAVKIVKRERESRVTARKEWRTERLLRPFNYFKPYKIILIMAMRWGRPKRIIVGNETCLFRNDYRFQRKKKKKKRIEMHTKKFVL